MHWYIFADMKYHARKQDGHIKQWLSLNKGYKYDLLRQKLFNSHNKIDSTRNLHQRRAHH